MEAFVGMQVLPANHRDTDYKEKRDYHKSVTTGQTDTGQSDPHVSLCFARTKNVVLICNIITLKAGWY